MHTSWNTVPLTVWHWLQFISSTDGEIFINLNSNHKKQWTWVGFKERIFGEFMALTAETYQWPGPSVILITATAKPNDISDKLGRWFYINIIRLISKSSLTVNLTERHYYVYWLSIIVWIYHPIDVAMCLAGCSYSWYTIPPRLAVIKVIIRWTVDTSRTSAYTLGVFHRFFRRLSLGLFNLWTSTPRSQCSVMLHI